MPTFEYHGYRSDGSKCKGCLKSESVKQAIRELSASGVFVDTIKSAGVTGKVSADRRSSFYRELGALLSAGISIDGALALLGGDSEDETSGGFLAAVVEKIHEGKGLSGSMSEIFPDMRGFEAAALDSAERTGMLSNMLSKIADFLDSRKNIRDKIRTALVYPAFILFLGILVASVMLGVVVPKTSTLLSSSGIEMPEVSKMIVFIAKIAAGAAVFAGIGISILIISAGNIAKKDPAFAVKWDRFVIMLPFMKAFRHLIGMRFASMLSVLTGAGMPVVAALPIAGAGTSNRWIQKCVDEQTEEVRNGRSLSKAVSALPLIGRELGEWTRVGEAGGCIVQMLDVATGRFQREWDRILTRRLAMLEPVMLLIVGMFVLVLALALMLPVVNMTKNIGM